LSVDIRSFKEEDIVGIVKVFRSWWAGEDTRIFELVESPNFDHNGLFVAEKDREIVGFAYAYIDPRIEGQIGRKLGFLAGIFKIPSVSREVAVRLLEKSIRYLREMKAVEVEIPDFRSSLGNGVTAEKDSDLFKLYQDSGFRINMHSYDMSRSLENLEVPSWVRTRRRALLSEGFILRKARKDDASALLEVHEEAFKESYEHLPITKDNIEQAINEINLQLENTILFEKDRKIVGCSDFSIEKYGKTLVGYPCVAVLPACREKGLGTVLFWENLERLKEAGVSIAGVTAIGVNYAAIHMYRKAGFVIDRIWYHLRRTI